MGHTFSMHRSSGSIDFTSITFSIWLTFSRNCTPQALAGVPCNVAVEEPRAWVVVLESHSKPSE